MGYGNDSGPVLRHALAFAAELYRRCVINKETAKRAAERLGLDSGQTAGAVRMMRAMGRLPSVERCAVTVMLDHGMEDADIAEIFGRSEQWAKAVRASSRAIRAKEPVSLELEYLDDGLRPGDPSPAEIRRMAEHIRANRIEEPGKLRCPKAQGGLRCYGWNPNNASIIPIIAAKWSGG